MGNSVYVNNRICNLLIKDDLTSDILYALFKNNIFNIDNNVIY